MNTRIGVACLSVLLVGSLGMTSGCATFRGPDKPELFNPKSQKFMTLAEYDAYKSQFHKLIVSGTPAEREQAERLRNDVLSQLLSEVDTIYDEYEEAVRLENIGFNVARDWAEIGLSTAVVLTGGAGAKTIIGAALTAVQGGTLSLDKNVYAQRAKEAIIAQMQADRAAVRIAIVRKMTTSSPEFYTLSDARSDALEYLRAGTIGNALQHLAMEASKKAIESKGSLAELPRVRKVPSSDLLLSEKIRNEYYRIANTEPTKGMQEAINILKAVDSTYNPPDSRDKVLADLKAVMTKASDDPKLFAKLADAMKLKP